MWVGMRVVLWGVQLVGCLVDEMVDSWVAQWDVTKAVQWADMSERLLAVGTDVGLALTLVVMKVASLVERLVEK